MAAILLLLIAAALCSGQLTDHLDTLDDLDRDCLGEETWPCLEGGCVPRALYCNGVPDCPDGSDEEMCPHRTPPPELCNWTHHYLCADSHRCIPNSWLCNNETDCEDGSDEANCTAVTVTNPNNTCKGFVCDGGKCISNLWLCDGNYDCKDKTDEFSEETCRHTALTHALRDLAFCENPPIPFQAARHYRCLDSSFCLPQQYMCDGMADCRDGSDEGEFCQHWEKLCTKYNLCKGNNTVCYPERFGAACACDSALSLQRYNYTTERCVAVDQCAELRPVCSHACENTGTHYTCQCEEGYTSNELGYLCFAGDPEPMLFFTTSTDIRYVKITSKVEVVVATGLKEAHGVSYDGKYLYWVETEHGHQAIMRAQLEDFQGTKEVLVSLGLEDPGDISVDWVGGHIYFSDVHRGSIAVCRTDGSMCTTLRTDTRSPRFVTLAVKHGLMYWADLHHLHRPVIMTARMDGTHAQVLVDSLHSFATGLAVDVPNARLYYVDETIKVFKLDDKQSYTLFKEPFHHPYSVAVFENSVFWSDSTANTIQSMDKLHGVLLKRYKVTALETPVHDIHVYHPLLFGHQVNPCEHKTCSHLCLLTSNVTAVCACPDGMTLRDNTTCEHINGYRPRYLVVGGGSALTRFDYHSLGNPETHTTHFDIGYVHSMAYDNTRDVLYVFDGQRKNIDFINMSDFSLGLTQEFFYQGLDNIVDMDYDYTTDSLYILDAGRRCLEVVSVRTRQRALLARFGLQEDPLSFCLMPHLGKLMVAVLITELDLIHVETISLDGESRVPVLLTDLRGPRVILRYDRYMDLVYVADEGNSIIDVIHPEGTGRDNFREMATSMSSLAVTNLYLFWTDRRTKLYWTNVHEASHYIRSIEFSIFKNSSHLHIQATYPPPDPHDLFLSHPCLKSHPCSHVCVQGSNSSHNLTHDSVKSTPGYKCLCPPGLLNVDGQCTLLARCKENELFCHKSNVCIWKGKRCDGVKDCADGEDEDFCDERHKIDKDGCSRGYKLCNDICVENSQNCGTEDPTTSTVTTPKVSRCKSNEFQCVNSSICIERSQLCDGWTDCLNGSDEDSSLCELFVCQSSEFMCTLGSCIQKAFQCDGDNDCADGSDEVDCENMSCSKGYYQCRNKQCIEMRKRCDGHGDCTDDSDEEECEEQFPDEEPVPTCTEDEFSCTLNRSICLPLTARCNLKTDCPSGTDEWGCDFICKDKFACKQELLCISHRRVCDGTRDCSDGSDEAHDICNTTNTSHLHPSILLPADECREGFLCTNGQCLEWRQVCDKEVNCIDSSDENGLCATACANDTCEGVCQPTPLGAVCRCAAGLLPAGGACVDDDECARAVCAQECRNVHGSFLCACHHGYTLRRDRRTCKADQGDLAILYLSESTVWSFTPDGKAEVEYHEPNHTAVADLDVDVRRNKLYVTRTEAGQLIEVNDTKSNVVVTNIGRPTKVAVDWITGNVYFVDSTSAANCIRVCNVMKKKCAKLQKLPINTEVTSLVIDPPFGRMFYCATRDSRSAVWSASLAGQDALNLTPARGCSGLAVDSFKQLLYVAETKPPRVFRMTFSGDSQQTIVDDQHTLQSLHSLALFEDYVFFLNSGSLKLHRCSLFGKTKCQAYMHQPIGATSFVVRHPSAQRGDAEDACAGAACGALCVGGARAACLCADGRPPPDGGECRLVDKEQLPLFNGWTQDQYQHAQHATLTVVVAILAACALYLLVFLYYQCVRRPRRARAYMGVHFQNANEQSTDASTTVVEVPDAPGPAHEFVNPLEYVRDLWEQVRRQNRPVGTAGLDISVPYAQQDLSDTESDLDEREHKNIIRK